MDLLQIARKIWRYKLVALPVIALTLCGAAYVIAFKGPVYEASASYVLINPPPPPTEQEIARDPSLSGIDADNPFTRFADQSVVVRVLASTLSTESAREALVEAGADSRYTVAPSSEFGVSAPILQVTARGDSPETAVRTAEVVSDAVTRELDRMQQAEGVNARYRISTQQVDAPDSAKLLASGMLRTLLGVFALGAVLLFVVVSVAEALPSLRRKTSQDALPSQPAGVEPLGSVAGDQAEVMAGIDGEHGSAASGGSIPPVGPIDLFPHPTATVSSRERLVSELPDRQDQPRSST